MPNGSDRVWRKGQVHHRPHSAMVESRPHSFFSSIPCGENISILLRAFGKAMVAQTLIGPIHLSPVRERKDEWQDDTYSREPLTIRTGRSPSSRNYVLRPMGFIWGKLSIKATRYLRTKVGRHPRWPRAWSKRIISTKEEKKRSACRRIRWHAPMH